MITVRSKKHIILFSLERWAGVWQ